MGADEGFDEFVRSRGDDLRRLAFLLTDNRADAEDLVQSALVKSLPRWTHITSRDDPYAYVRTVLVNTRRSWWRKHKGRSVTVADVPDRAAAGDAYAAYDVRDELGAALAELSDGQRKVVVLRFFEDLSEAETARVLGISPGTVKSQSSRALARLRAAVATTDSTDGSTR